MSEGHLQDLPLAASYGCMETLRYILQKAFFKHVLECIYLKVYRENEKYGIKEF